MPRLLLLVTSDLSSARIADAKRLGLEAVQTLGAGDVLLLRRDAFASEASAQKFRRVAFDLDGTRVEDGVRGDGWYDPEQALPFERVSWPLYRDQKLVTAAAKALQAGWDVSALILHDGARDVATEHLLRLCKTHGVRGKLVLPIADAAISTSDLVVLPSSERATWTERDHVWTDTETTGLSHNLYHVIQIGSVHCDPSSRVVRREFELKLRIPQGHIPSPEALAINGYSDERWKDAVDPAEGMRQWLAWLPPSFVHTNQSASFDRNHLAAMCGRYGLGEPGWGSAKRDVCTKKMAYQWLVKTQEIADAKLATICAHLGISNVGSHDALTDARRARLAYLKMIEKRSGATFDATGTDD